MTWARRAIIIAALGTASCRPASDNVTVENDSENLVFPVPPLPVAEPPINREALLLAVAKAASTAGLGRDDAAVQRKLDGKRFEVRIRFGCTAAEQELNGSGGFSVRFDDKDRTLRISASPDLSLDDALVATVATGKTEEEANAMKGRAIEAAEGFSIRRPWLLADGCPLSQAQDEPAETGLIADERSLEKPRTAKTANSPEKSAKPAFRESADHRVGLAEFFTETDSRTGRRDNRAYEATKVLGDDEQPSAVGYNLVLSGRLRAQPVGRVISCPVLRADASPQCIVSVAFDRVWIEQPGSKAVVAEWGS